MRFAPSEIEELSKREDLGIPEQYRLIETILELMREITTQNSKFGKVLDAFFRRAIHREDKQLLDPEFLRKIDEILMRCQILHATLFSFADKQISPEYRQRLIGAYLAIWKIDPEAYLSDVLYQLLVNLLDETPDSPETRKILKDLNDLALRLWAQLYFNLLEEDCGIIDEFTREDIVLHRDSITFLDSPK